MDEATLQKFIKYKRSICRFGLILVRTINLDNLRQSYNTTTSSIIVHWIRVFWVASTQHFTDQLVRVVRGLPLVPDGLVLGVLDGNIVLCANPYKILA